MIRRVLFATAALAALAVAPAASAGNVAWNVSIGLPGVVVGAGGPAYYGYRGPHYRYYGPAYAPAYASAYVPGYVPPVAYPYYAPSYYPAPVVYERVIAPRPVYAPRVIHRW